MIPATVLRQAAALLRRLLDLAESGELAADSPVDRRMLRRIEGAAAALEAARDYR